MPNLPALYEAFRDKIVAAARPKLIYCVDSLWIVVVAENGFLSPVEAARVINPIFHTQRSFQHCLLTTTQLVAEIRKGNIILTATCLPENLIYDTGEISPVLNTDKRMEVVSQAISDFHFGVGRSISLTEGAVFHFARNEITLSFFMLHQAAEQIMRGLLISLTLHNPKTHSLQELNIKLRKCMPSLVFLEDKGSDEKYLMEKLDYSYSAARYNVSFDVADADFWTILQNVKDHRAASLRLFNGLIEAFKPITQTTPIQ